MATGDVGQSAPRLAAVMGASSRKQVTPSDTVNLPGAPCRAIYSATAGNINLALVDDGGSDPDVYAFAAGEIKSLQAVRIYNTSTTCTGIKALY